MSTYVIRPADLGGSGPEDLLQAWSGHGRALVYDRCGIERLTRTDAVRHALDELATGQALADYVTRGRWATVAQGLVYGATVSQVAVAMGLDVDEVAAGLRSWADGQLAINLITPVLHDELQTLLTQGGAR
ncbi:hypothetical protein BJF78_24590 [Pseudonocardia sp. CNS-139]|nr:hypothetical protein BJF78_24590 [Pseudonocardia sp. CNS-139]